MLDSYENRIGMAITFGLVVNYCTNVVFADWGRIFTKDGAKDIVSWPPALGGKSEFHRNINERKGKRLLFLLLKLVQIFNFSIKVW